MLKRKCPNCSKKSLRVPVLSNNYVCSECVSIFNQTWLANLIETIVASAIGTAAFFYLVFYFSWIAVFVIFIVLPVLVDQVFRRLGPIKVGGVKGVLRKRS